MRKSWIWTPTGQIIWTLVASILASSLDSGSARLSLSAGVKLSFLISILVLAIVLPINLIKGTYVERVMRQQSGSGTSSSSPSSQSQTDVRASPE